MRTIKVPVHAVSIGFAILTAIAPLSAQAAKPTPEEEAKAAAVKEANNKVAAAKRALAEAQKAATSLVTDKEVEAIKKAARKSAQERISNRKDSIKALETSIAAKDETALKAFRESAFKEKLVRDKKTVQEAETETAEAKKTLAEKDAQVTITESEAKTARAAADKAPEDKDLAKKSQSAKSVADRALRSRNGALNDLRSKEATFNEVGKQVKAGKEVLSKIEEAKKLNKAYENAMANALAARKAVSQSDGTARKADRDARSARTAAAKKRDDKALAQKAIAAVATAKKLASAKTTAEKARREADKTVATSKRTADQANSAIEVFYSTAIAEKIDKERRNYEEKITGKKEGEKALAKASAAVESTIAKVDSSKSASDRSAATLTAANKSKTERIAAAKVVAERITTALADTNKALAKARKLEKKADKKSVGKAKANRKAVEKRLSQQTATKRKSDSQAASLKKTLEKNIGKLSVAAKKAATAAALAQTTADKAVSAKKAAAGNTALDEAPIKDALARLYQANTLIDGGLALLPADQWDYAKARHLLCRAGFGGTPQEVEDLHAMGLHAAVEFMVDFHEQAAMDLPFTASLPEPPIQNENRLDRMRRREITNVRRRVESVQQNRLRDWWIERMATSPRQLEEKLALFWHGHFATEYRTTRNSYAMYQQNQLFREHAAGNFGALLHGIVHDPAMLRYLDNNSNIKGRPNENLAREIMELFSLGEGNYAEEDIMEGARALTGYTYDTNTSQFRFIVSRHDSENKTIFGRTGAWAGDDFVDLILRQPFAPRFISRKLFVYFTYENPDDEIVQRMASVLSKHKYEMAPMLKNLFMSKEFYSKKSMATQIKSPVQLVIGTLRDLGVKDVTYGTLGSAVAGMGQEIFGPPNVRGWEGGQFWVNANRLFVRYNGVADLVENISIPDQPRGLDIVDVLEGKKLETPDQIVDFLARSCLIRPLTSEKKKVLIELAASLPPSSDWEEKRREVNTALRAILVLIMSMPEYQVI